MPWAVMGGGEGVGGLVRGVGWLVRGVGGLVRGEGLGMEGHRNTEGILREESGNRNEEMWIAMKSGRKKYMSAKNWKWKETQ